MPKASRVFSISIFPFITAVIVLFTALSLSAQPSGNPFEIKPRLGQMPESTGPATADVPTGNPFDIIAPIADDSVGMTGENPGAALIGPDVLKAPEPLEGFILGLLLFSFLLLAVLATLFRPYFQKIFRAFSNDNMLSQAHREYLQGQRLPYIAFYLTFMVNAGIFLFLLLRRYFDVKLDYNNWQLLLLCIVAVAAGFLFKHLLLFFVGWVFPVQKEIGTYSFTIIIFSIFIGIILFGANVFLALGTENILLGGIKLIVGIIALIYAFRAFRGLLIGSRFIPLYIFHFLLYICTAEIAPVAVVVKLIMNQL